MRPPLRVKLAFGTYTVGYVLTEVAGAYYDWLVNNGFCEPIKREEGEKVECATVSPAECAATRTAPKTRKRGRPRKVRTG